MSSTFVINYVIQLLGLTQMQYTVFTMELPLSITVFTRIIQGVLFIRDKVGNTTPRRHLSLQQPLMV
jgi:uncharacterized integral membrane protein